MPTGGGRRLDDSAADQVDLLAGREVHDRIRPEADGRQHLLDLAGGIARNGRLADVGVDLGACGDADADGAKLFARWALLAGITIRPSCHLAADEF